jgi:NADPH:quinone reductase-like Zn-dependent oxidoreductase
MTSTLMGNTAQSPAPSTMMAWRVHEFGPPEAMIFETAPRPAPGPGEVLVRVHAAGLGPWDGWIRAGKSALPQPLPLTLGSDLSGEVAALGSGIFGLAREYVVILSVSPSRRRERLWPHRASVALRRLTRSVRLRYRVLIAVMAMSELGQSAKYCSTADDIDGGGRHVSKVPEAPSRPEAIVGSCTGTLHALLSNLWDRGDHTNV